MVNNMNTKIGNKALLENRYYENLQENSNLTLQDRKAFMKLSIEERRKILEKQAQELVKYYEINEEWKETQGVDFIEY